MIWIAVAVASLIIVFIYYFLNKESKVPGLQNKCVLVTGCDSGFGHELVLSLDSQGLRVFAGCLTERGETVLRSKCSTRLKTIRMDVTKHEDIQRSFSCVSDFLKSTNDSVLWGVVNNAGIANPMPMEWTTMQDIKKVFDVNVWGLLEVTKTFLPLVKKSKGRIINVASVAGKIPLKGAGAYSASKFAVQCFSGVLRNELRPFGVSVHIIDPGFFKTNITDFRIMKQYFEQRWNSLSQEMRDEYGHDFFDKAIKKMKIGSGMASEDIGQVIDAMEHAVTSTRPKIRYILGWDHKLLWRWLALAPSEVQDFIIQRLA